MVRLLEVDLIGAREYVQIVTRLPRQCVFINLNEPLRMIIIVIICFVSMVRISLTHFILLLI